MAEIIESLPVPAMKLGEGPHWLPQENTLLYVDVFDKAIKKYDVRNKKQRVLYLDNPEAPRASMAIPIETNKPKTTADDNLYIIGLGKTVSVVNWTQGGDDVRRVKPDIIHTTSDNHINDAKCDRKKRLWFGTMTYLNDKEEPGGRGDSGLYRCDQNLQVTKSAAEPTSISNGLAWSSDDKQFFFIDSVAAKVYVFDYDIENGTAGNQRVLFDYQKNGMLKETPDGMTIDSDGNLWVACFSGAKVICIDTKTQQIKRKIELPSQQITSACFGGPDLSTLYVTTGWLRMSDKERSVYPKSGDTFAISNLGVRGCEGVNFLCDSAKLGQFMSV